MAKYITLRAADISVSGSGDLTATFSRFLTGYPDIELRVSERGDPGLATKPMDYFISKGYFVDALKVSENGEYINGFENQQYAVVPSDYDTVNKSFPVVQVLCDLTDAGDAYVCTLGKGCINATYHPSFAARSNFQARSFVFDNVDINSGDVYLYAYTDKNDILYLALFTVYSSNSVEVWPTFWGGPVTDALLTDKVGTPTKIVFDPEENYFYKNVTDDSSFVWKDRVNIYIEHDTGIRKELTRSQFSSMTVTTSDPIHIISPKISQDSLYGFNYLIEYKREAEVPAAWSLNVSIGELTGSFKYIPINGISNTYTPEIGSGIGGSGGFPNSQGGGGGNFGTVNGTPETSNPIAPSLPGLGGIGGTTGSAEGSIGNAGMFVHYAMNSTLLKTVGEWLWADNLGLLIAKEVMSILYGSPIESAISLMSYPFDIRTLPGISITNQNLYWGAHDIGYQAPAITDPYATIDWGTIQLTEFWGNFLDYAPHTKLELYLPWCTGFVPIDPNECLPGTLRVVTNIELAKGTCLHNIIGNDERVIATYSGTCGKQLPLTALDTSGKALSLVSTAISLGVSGGAGAAATSAGNQAYGQFMQGAHQMGISPRDAVSAGHRVRQEAMAPHQRTQQRAKNTALAGAVAATRTPSNVQRSGSFSGSSAGLGVQFPYLILSRPTQSVPSQYGHHYGYPSNIFASLYNLKGYTEIGEIHLTGIPATDSELSELDSILKGGVIL